MRSHQRNVSKGVTCSNLQKVCSSSCVENRFEQALDAEKVNQICMVCMREIKDHSKQPDLEGRSARAREEEKTRKVGRSRL